MSPGLSSLLDEQWGSDQENFRRKWEQRALERTDFVSPATRILKNPTSVAFGGKDGRIVYVGSLGGDTLATFLSPVAGRPIQNVEALRPYLRP